MDGVDVMRLFVRIVERRSFSQASKDLLVPRATAEAAPKMTGQFLTLM